MDVNNVKCVNCKNCIGFENGFYICQITTGEVEYVEEWCANDEELHCEGYVDEFEEVYDKDSDVNPTERS